MRCELSLYVYVEVPANVDFGDAVKAFWADSELIRAGLTLTEDPESRMCYIRLLEADLGSQADDLMHMLRKHCSDIFKTDLRGYWLEDSGCQISRCEFRGDKIVFDNADWLLNYTVEQMEAIRAYAETTFGKP